jgi:single-strand DNA-binding protein
MNSVNFTGNLVKDPEHIEAGDTQITNMRVAVDVPKDKDPIYVAVKTFNGQAVACHEALRKGSRVAVSGRLAFDQWKNDNDEPRSKLYVIATVDFLDKKAAEEPSEPEPAQAA